MLIIPSCHGVPGTRLVRKIMTNGGRFCPSACPSLTGMRTSVGTFFLFPWPTVRQASSPKRSQAGDSSQTEPSAWKTRPSRLNLRGYSCSSGQVVQHPSFSTGLHDNCFPAQRVDLSHNSTFLYPFFSLSIFDFRLTAPNPPSFRASLTLAACFSSSEPFANPTIPSAAGATASKYYRLRLASTSY